VITSAKGQPMNAQTKLIAIAAISVTSAVASFQSDVALALGIGAFVAAVFTGLAVLVGAAVSTRHTRPVMEKGRAPVLDAAPNISPQQR